MAIGTAPAEQRVIERQLRVARRQVKLIDLATRLIVLTVSVCAYLAALVVVDHWLWGLGAVQRWLALVGLVVGVGWYLVQHVGRYLLRGINPVYAARVIEEGAPSLQNSLINYLLLRSQREPLPESVLRAVERRAASDVEPIQVEAAIDHSSLFRLSYVLLGVITLALVYKIASPKDPLPTIARVFSPWSTIARPTRVSIQDVAPGDGEVYRGDSVTITARVVGVRDGDPVTLVYSTDDGQIIDRPVPMKATSDGLRHQVTLPPDPAGLLQDVTYRIMAGDATTPSYRIRVSPAPLLIVDKLEYEYPAYTRRERRTVQKQGDISAVEGTRVTLHARANVPFRSAWIEFTPPGEDAQNEGTAAANRSAKSNPVPPERVVHLDANGLDARQSFVLQWNAEQRQPRFGSYVLKLMTEDGQANQRPVVHRIEVFPDLPPELEILRPSESRIEVPENGEQAFEVRAIDPDFGLRRLSMAGKIANAPAFDAVLLEDAAGREGQVVVNWTFSPQQLGLQAGDEVTLMAVAQDNRSGPVNGNVANGNVAPNIRNSREVTVRIVAARTNNSDPAERPDEKPTPDAQKPDPQKPDPQKPDSQKPDSQKPDAQKPDSQKPDSQKPDASKPDSQKPDSQKPESPKPGSQKPDKSKPDSQKPDSQKSDSSKGNGSGSSDGSGQAEKPEDQPNGSGSSAAKPPKNSSASKPAGGQGAGKQSSDPSQQGNSPGADDGDSSTADPGGSDPMKPGSTRPGQRDSSNKAPPGTDASGATPGAGSPDSDANSPPNEPLDDGDVFEKALDFLKKKDAQGQGSDRADNKDKPGQQTQGKNSATKNASRTNDAESDPPRPNDAPGQNAPGQNAPGQNATDSKDSAVSPPSPKPGSPKPDSAKPGSPGSSGEKGKDDAAKSEGGMTDGVAEPKPSDAPQPPDGRSPAGKPGSGSSGQTGSGQSSKDPQTSPTPLDKNADRPKTPQPGTDSGNSPQETPAPSESKRQSDSQSDSQGDKSGGGKQGGGQGANQKGNDSAGSNSPGDEGAGAANQPGAGEPGAKPGDQRQAPGATGQPGRDKGPGSTKAPNSTNGTPGSGSPDSPNGKPGEPEKGKPESVGAPGGGGTPQRTGGGGLPSDVRPTGAGRDGAVPEGDAANLEYARKATDLVLEYLKDQQDKPDQQLLDRLGWTPEDLRRFVERWESLKRNSQDVDPGKARELDESLRSLGLRPSVDARRAAGVTGDAVRGNRDAGARSNPPSKYQDRFDAFRRGTSRSQ